jgi:hypothetical protein
VESPLSYFSNFVCGGGAVGGKLWREAKMFVRKPVFHNHAFNNPIPNPILS